MGIRFWKARDSVALPVLELRNVDLDFDGHNVLRALNLKIHADERIAVIGPSGQGKSSLLKLLAGLVPPSRGELWVEGECFHALSPTEQQRLRLKMGMLFQKNALFDSMPNLENLCFPLREAGWAEGPELISRAEDFLEAVGLTPAAHLYPDEISGGMQKRLGIARALALDPEIVFYDDPTAGLDPITSRKIVDLIVQLQQKKKSCIVAVTNDMNRASQLGQRVMMVVDQGVIEVGTPDEMRQHPDPRVHQFVLGLTRGPLTGLG